VFPAGGPVSIGAGANGRDAAHERRVRASLVY